MTNLDSLDTEAADADCERLQERIARVADLSITSPYFVWDWGEAIAMQALVIAAQATSEERFTDWVSSRLDLWRQIHPDPFWPDHMGSGVALIWQHQRTGDPEILRYAERLGQHLGSLPRARTGARLLRPDKPDIASFVWVDSLYTDGPFLCELARASGDDAWFNEAASHIEGMCQSLQDPVTGLFAHRYDETTGTTNGVFWGRGCGWAALGLGHTLSVLSATHPAWSTLAERFRRFAERAASLQSASGHWNAVLDRPETLLESSTTALFGEGFALGTAALGEEYTSVIDRAWNAVAAEVANDGREMNVSQRSPSSPSWESYATLPHGGIYPWGQGP